MSLAGLLAVSAAMVAGCQGDEPATTPGSAQTTQARVVESQQQQVPVSLRSTGTVHARETSVVSAQVMGRIQQVTVREGDNVRAGQTLVALDDAALRAQLEQAEAGVKASQNASSRRANERCETLQRARCLASHQFQSRQFPRPPDPVRAEQQRRASAACADRRRASNRRAARARCSGTRIVAPFAGVVTARMADPGTTAAPGVPLLQVDQTTNLQLQATVDQSVIGVIHKGMKEVVIDGVSSGTWPVRLPEIVPAADPSSHSFL